MKIPAPSAVLAQRCAFVEKRAVVGQGFEPANVEPEVVVIGKTLARRRAATETLRPQ